MFRGVVWACGLCCAIAASLPAARAQGQSAQHIGPPNGRGPGIRSARGASPASRSRGDRPAGRVRAPQIPSSLALAPALRSRQLTPFVGALYYDEALAASNPAPWPGPETVDAEPAPVPVLRRAYSGPSSIQPPAPGESPRASSAAKGTLRLDVLPRTAQVYVDGFYAGTVDALEARGGLTADAGWHRLELRAPGCLTPAANVTIEANRTIVFRLALQPIP